MSSFNKTPCRAVPSTTSKAELKELHKAKQKHKKTVRKHEAQVDSKRVFRVCANVGKDHPKHGLHPKEAY